MQRVTRSTAVAVQPAPPGSAGPPGFFTGGNPLGAIPATVPGYEWHNSVQEEIVAPVLRAGMALDPADQAQLRKALDRLFGGGLRTVTANTVLTADDAGLVVVNASGGNRTVTLPAASAAGGRPLRFYFVRWDNSANTVTIQRAGADTIEGAASINLAVGERLPLISDGGGGWYFPAGRFTGSLTTQGWSRLPNGLILQWGQFAPPNNTSQQWTVTYPVAFPTGTYSVVGSLLNSTVAIGALALYNAGTTGFNFGQNWVGGQSANLNVYWQAIGG